MYLYYYKFLFYIFTIFVLFCSLFYEFFWFRGVLHYESSNLSLNFNGTWFCFALSNMSYLHWCQTISDWFASWRNPDSIYRVIINTPDSESSYRTSNLGETKIFIFLSCIVLYSSKFLRFNFTETKLFHFWSFFILNPENRVQI